MDRGQIGTVLVNLLLNALDAVAVGGRVEVTIDEPAGGTVRISVVDTGAGIPENVLGRLFTPFVTTKATGTGLGLSLSARILEEHGGAISGGNRPEGGAQLCPDAAGTVHLRVVSAVTNGTRTRRIERMSADRTNEMRACGARSSCFLFLRSVEIGVGRGIRVRIRCSPVALGHTEICCDNAAGR